MGKGTDKETRPLPYPDTNDTRVMQKPLHEEGTVRKCDLPLDERPNLVQKQGKISQTTQSGPRTVCGQVV